MRYRISAAFTEAGARVMATWTASSLRVETVITHHIRGTSIRTTNTLSLSAVGIPARLPATIDLHPAGPSDRHHRVEKHH